MKKISLQWRITLMTVLLIGVTCVAMNLLLCSSGVYYMDKIADALQGSGTVILNEGEAASQSGMWRNKAADSQNITGKCYGRRYYMDFIR